METIGSILRTEREKKGMSIKDIENATSIRSLYINAIEENDFKVIPGEVYLKGFIRNYASCLGLNPQEIMEIYRKAHAEVLTPIETNEPSIEASPSTNVNSENISSETKSSLGKWLTIGLVTFSITGAIFWWFNSSPSTPIAPPLKEQTQNNVPPPKTAPANPPAIATKPVSVTVKFTDNCWISVTADGKEIHEGTQKSGESFTWEAQNTLTIKAGNAGGVDITYNGRPMGKLGTKGEVALKTFSSNNQKP